MLPCLTDKHGYQTLDSMIYMLAQTIVKFVRLTSFTDDHKRAK